MGKQRKRYEPAFKLEVAQVVENMTCIRTKAG